MALRIASLILASYAVHAAAVAADEIAKIPQVWSTVGVEYADTDSLAACRLPDGRVEVYATAKAGARIDVFDAATGKFLRSFGSPGAGVGQFAYPNGVAVVEFPAANKTRSALLVVERDNARVQAFWTDSGSPAGIFGAEVLHRPYGGAVACRAGKIRFYVTDTEVPLDQTVKVFELSLRNDQIAAKLTKTFGDASGPGAVVEAESIAVDERLGRVFLCDEGKTQRNVKVYDLDGQFTGRVFGGDQIVREPEGVVILDEPGLVVLTDQQKKVSVWHVYDRTDYKHLAAFTGDPLIANTDGICVFNENLGEITGGLFMAVHDDRDVRAYRLSDVLKQMPDQDATAK